MKTDVAETVAWLVAVIICLLSFGLTVFLIRAAVHFILKYW